MDDLSGTFHDKAYFRVEQRTVFFRREQKGRGSKGYKYDLKSIKTSNYPLRGDSSVGKKRREARGKGARVILHRTEHIELFIFEGIPGPF